MSRPRRTLAIAASVAILAFALAAGVASATQYPPAPKIPASVLRSRGETIALAARFERLLSGLYLGGVESTVNPLTRLLIGRQLAASSRNLTLLRDLRGSKVDLRPVKPLSVEYVGIQFDQYLSVPGA